MSKNVHNLNYNILLLKTCYHLSLQWVVIILLVEGLTWMLMAAD